MAELNLYEVPHRNGTMLVKLSEDEADSVYGDLAKKIRPIAPATPQPVTTPPWAEDVDSDEDEPGEKKAPAPRNKTRSATSKG